MTSLTKLAGGICLATTMAGVSAADSMPSAKVTARASALNIVEYKSTAEGGNGTSSSDWQTVFQTKIKTSNQKDLFISPSFQVGLLTGTVVKSKLATADTSLSSAGVNVRVLVDGNVALPGPVTYNQRSQKLTAIFQGIIADCLSIGPGPDGILNTEDDVIVLDPDCVTPEELALVLDTTSAHSFNFIVPNVASGIHDVKVQAAIDLGVEAQTGSAEAQAVIGAGSVTVESVRMIKDEDVTELP